MRDSIPRNRVPSEIPLSPSPFGYGIAAAIREWVASDDAEKREKGSDDYTPFTDRLDGVFGAGWSESAGRLRLERGDESPIEPDRDDKHLCEGRVSLADK